MSRKIIFVGCIFVYAMLCVLILLATEPWKGGDESISFVFLINAISFPAGMIASLILFLLSILASGTSYAWITETSPFWWSFLLIGCVVLGFAQWQFVLPRVFRLIRNRFVVYRPDDP